MAGRGCRRLDGRAWPFRVTWEIGNDSGNASHAQPVCNAYTIAATAIRSSMRGRPPPWCLSGCAGSSGCTRCHNDSGQYFSTSLTLIQRVMLVPNDPY
jgi:hypothetical protein